MAMMIYRDFTIEAAHRLPSVPKGHKCENMHGHSWAIKIGITGEVNEDGWVLDFAHVDEAFAPIFKDLDHSVLNEKIDNPTSENLAIYIWNRLENAFDLYGGTLAKVTIGETCRCGVTYDGP